ncbi:MAG: SMP-30/gluconolactonase/LRE family protein [Bacteroidota bacterium]
MMNSNSALQPRPLPVPSCVLGEGPLWDMAQQLICWVDIVKGTVHQYTPASNSHTVIAVNQMVGAIGLCTNGHFIAALQNGFGFIDRSSHQVNMLQDPEQALPGNRFNDGKCGPDGGFWAGTMAQDEAPGAGSLYCLQPDLSVIKKIEGVSISNGIAWSSDNRIFYYIDTPTQTVAAYDYEMAGGRLSNRRVVIHVPVEEGFPDGMTIDNEGMLWIAFWGGWKLARWNPHTGKKLLEIGFPVSQVSSCAFGGKDLQDLFVTTAAEGLTPEEIHRQPLAGSVFVIEHCGFTGLPPFYFGEMAGR